MAEKFRYTDDPLPAPEGYGGRIGRTFAESTPWWPPQVKAPQGAPNIVFIYLDDVGFGDFGCFGSEIATPNIDRLAAGGLRLSGYTTVPMCLPARAALLTGRNPHAVGCGWQFTTDPGYPGFGGEIAANAPTIAELLRDQGYSTMAVGKWHNTRERNTSDAGDRSSWPLQRGFDRYYGFMNSETSYFQPEQMREGNQLADVDAYPKDYYLTDDLTDRAVRWMKEHAGAAPRKPFFLYLPYNAAHVPLQAKPSDIARYQGRYDAGWDVIRQQRFERQQALGVMPRHARLPPHNPGVRAWDTLSAEEKRIIPKYMEIFAAMVDSADQGIGRVVAALEQMGALDNTLIIVTSDNGGNSLGAQGGAVNSFERRFGKDNDTAILERILAEKKFGGEETYIAYPTGWAQVSNTPFRQYKRYTMNGGLRVPFVAHWPRGIDARGAVRNDWVHVTDIAPTLLDIIGLSYPAEFKGLKTNPQDGVSFRRLLSGAEMAPRPAQAYELEGNRGFIRGGWKLVSLQPKKGRINLENWMLFDLTRDPTEIDDLAKSHPDKLAEMVAAFEADAAANWMYPLDNREYDRSVTHPPHRLEEVNAPRTFYPGAQTIDRANVWPLFADRCYRITAHFEFRPGDRGVLFTVGTVFGGTVAFVLDDALHFVYQRWQNPLDCPPIPLQPGLHRFELDYRATGQRKGEGRLLLDGVEKVSMTDMSPSLGRLPHEGVDVGIDRRSATSSRYAAHGVFRYSGTISRVEVVPGAQAPGSIFNRSELEAQRAALEWMR
jgi:arylsulfatase